MNVTSLNFDFSATNFAGSAATSGYALSICPFTFVFNNDAYAFLSDTRVLWDFGDGTTSQLLTATHYYSMPGTYNATLYMYNSANQVFSSNAKALSVFNYIADNIVLSASSTQLTASTIANPLLITRYNTWQNQPMQPVLQLRVDNSDASFASAQQYMQDAELHLKTTSKFYQPTTLPTGTIDYNCIDTVVTTHDKIFVKLSGTNIVTCLSSDANSVFAGSSGIATVYYVDDLPGHPTASVKFDTSMFVDLQTAQLSSKLYPQFSVLQMAADTMQYTVSSNVATQLTFSSNGIETPNFDINANCFAGAKIPFVVRASGNGAPVKNGYKLTLVEAASSIVNNSVYVVAMSGNEVLDCIVRSDFGNLQFYPRGGFFKGYITVPFVADNVYLSATGNMRTSQGDVYLIQGASNTFNVYSSAGGYIANKFNEDFDYLSTLKNYRFQESLQNTDAFFDSVLGPIVGTVTSPNNTLGKRLYERIANFVANNVGVDECDIAALDSLYQMAGESLQSFESLKFAAPADLKAQMDLLSIKHSKLWGARNAYKQDFENNGYVDIADYGRNLGSKLDVATARLSAFGTGDAAYIVAYEKFSGKYLLCNTNIPVYLTDPNDNTSWVPTSYDKITQTYLLNQATTYLNQWGWPLVLPQDASNINLDDYYVFYTYKSVPQNAQLEGVIDWSNANNTLQQSQSSLVDWTKNGGIIDNMLSYKIAAGLQLFNDDSVTNVPGYVDVGFFYLDDNKSQLLLNALSANFALVANTYKKWDLYTSCDLLQPASIPIAYTGANVESLRSDTQVFSDFLLSQPLNTTSETLEAYYYDSTIDNAVSINVSPQEFNVYNVYQCIKDWFGYTDCTQSTPITVYTKYTVQTLDVGVKLYTGFTGNNPGEFYGAYSLPTFMYNVDQSATVYYVTNGVITGSEACV